MSYLCTCSSCLKVIPWLDSVEPHFPGDDIAQNEQAFGLAEHQPSAVPANQVNSTAFDGTSQARNESRDLGTNPTEFQCISPPRLHLSIQAFKQHTDYNNPLQNDFWEGRPAPHKQGRIPQKKASKNQAYCSRWDIKALTPRTDVVNHAQIDFWGDDRAAHHKSEDQSHYPQRARPNHQIKIFDDGFLRPGPWLAPKHPKKDCAEADNTRVLLSMRSDWAARPQEPAAKKEE